MFNKFIISSIVLCLAFVTCGCSKDKADENAIVVGTNAEFPPFTYIDHGKIIGFDIDIANEVANRMGKEMHLVNMPFDALIASVDLQKVDFVAAGITATEERARKVLFTKPYIQGDPLVIVTENKKECAYHGLEDFIGKAVVVNEGYTADLYMSSKVGFELIRLPTAADGFLAVKSGRAEAFITALSTVQSFTDTQDITQFKTIPLEGTEENCALIVSRGDANLLGNIQTALDSMQEDGTIAELKTKWKLK